MLRVLVFLVVDTILYYALTRYFDLVKAGDWGISLPWYFCCMPSYWVPEETKVKELKKNENPLVENLPAGPTPGFELVDVIKEFKVKKEVSYSSRIFVRFCLDFNLDFYL